ncbi:hypothetical protein LTR36_006399 [Oleoguttula mirabilis]|uniref:Ataxin-10 homolog n=1 Tax=Oleoguttula mirabilis TaxID=1507867 RepID=A0AAV9JUK4_9PEZI|nr:hypothetical protein LTR36_006399 [Oleoguttula mirabilis]
MARAPPTRLQKAHSVFVRLVFPAYTVHFKSPTYVRDTTLDLLDKKVCKETLKSTAQDGLIRIAIGTDTKFWAELVVLFKAAIPSLERRSFTIWDPSSVDYESTSGALIASNYPTLWKDLERLNDLVSISRNVLTIGPAAQDLAASHHIDGEIFRLINVCVRVTARGYDGEAGTGDEEKWQWIVNAYKKLLITGLQFLNNLVARNERGKLLLWLALFDQQHNTGADGNAAGGNGTASAGVLAPEDIPETSRTSLADVPSNPTTRPDPPITAQDILIAYGTNAAETLDLHTLDPAPISWQKEAHQTHGPLHANHPPQDILDAANLVIGTIFTTTTDGHLTLTQIKTLRDQYLRPNAYVFFGARTHATTVSNYTQMLGREPTAVECYYELARQWNRELREQDREYWQGLYEDALARYKADLAVWGAKGVVLRWDSRRAAPFAQGGEGFDGETGEWIAELGGAWGLGDDDDDDDDDEGEDEGAEGAPAASSAGLHGASATDGLLSFSRADQSLQDRAVVPDDLKMLFTASAGARILESGKSELLKRLEGYGSGSGSGNGNATAPPAPAEDVLADPLAVPGMERTRRSMSRSPLRGSRSPQLGLEGRAQPRRMAGRSESWVRAAGGRAAGAAAQVGRRDRSGQGERVGVEVDVDVAEVRGGEEEVELGTAGKSIRVNIHVSTRGGGDVVAAGADGAPAGLENGVEGSLPPLLDDPAAIAGELDEEDERESGGEGEEMGEDEEVDEDEEVGEEDEEEEEEEEEDEGEEEEEEEEEDDEEEDYPGSTEDGRGLLTDVPLILGPSEIEVLPMLIMSGIVPPPPAPSQTSSTDPPSSSPTTTTPCRTAIANLHTIRTHLLLSHSTGRNLLRELLIFVAAWDLREEELYFKFMVKIMEAILKNGLMPYAYHAFRDRSRSKDIISPAQAVVMKLLTCIFRGRGGEGGGGGKEARGLGVGAQAGLPGTSTTTMEGLRGEGRVAGDPSTAAAVGGEHTAAPLPSTSTSSTPAGEAVGPASESEPDTLARRKHLATQVPSRTDLHILNFIFTEFRQHIIPQTCALIFLQQQIHAGRASPEDFPLNLWDMERMYEGVYQYLEFFAVLTEEGVWKGILGEWEMGVELVTLLRELEGEGAGAGGYGGGVVGVGGVGQEGGVGMVRRRVVGRQVEAVVPSMHAPVVVGQRSLSADAALPTGHGAQQVGTERPAFDVAAGSGRMPTDAILPPLPLHLPPPLSAAGHQPQQPIFEAETPLAYPEDTPILGSNGGHAPLPHPTDPAATTAAGFAPGTAAPPPLHPTGAIAPDQDEPSDFEWRNLKKLAVLVLSSLIWKNRKVQDQVREYGGLEALVSCCRHDENNPYIREHAIMCLRFAVEGCEANGEVIRGMAGRQQGGGSGGRLAQGQVVRGRQGGNGTGTGGASGLMGGSVTLAGEVGDVPQEVLDTSGYETFMDGKGQVGLRRKEVGQPAAAQPSASAYAAAAGPSAAASAAATTAGGAHASAGVAKHAPQQQPLPPPRLSATKMTAEKAAELMQNALRDLPLGDKLVTDRQKAEALAKLDRAFESTETVLGRGGRTAGGGGGGGVAGILKSNGSGNVGPGGAGAGAGGPAGA